MWGNSNCGTVAEKLFTWFRYLIFCSSCLFPLEHIALPCACPVVCVFVSSRPPQWRSKSPGWWRYAKFLQTSWNCDKVTRVIVFICKTLNSSHLTFLFSSFDECDLCVLCIHRWGSLYIRTAPLWQVTISAWRSFTSATSTRYYCWCGVFWWC